MQGGGLGNPAAATITFLGGAAGAGGTDTAGGFGTTVYFTINSIPVTKVVGTSI